MYKSQILLLICCIWITFWFAWIHISLLHSKHFQEQVLLQHRYNAEGFFFVSIACRDFFVSFQIHLLMWSTLLFFLPLVSTSPLHSDLLRSVLLRLDTCPFLTFLSLNWFRPGQRQHSAAEQLLKIYQLFVALWLSLTPIHCQLLLPSYSCILRLCIFFPKAKYFSSFYTKKLLGIVTS